MTFFFFKQKTAYEMRISDWSSDVCSSDLLAHRYAAFDFPLPVRKQHASFGRRILPRQVCKLSVIILIVEIDRRISDELTPDAQHRRCVTRKDRVPNHYHSVIAPPKIVQIGRASGRVRVVQYV